MKFATKEDIEVPADAAFDLLSDFALFERSAMRRGAEVTRTDTLTEPGVGMTWDVSFSLRGRMRAFALELTEYDRPNSMSVFADSASMTSNFDVEFVALSRTRTRVVVELSLKPGNLSARLLVQSLKLARTSLTRKYKLRVAEYARDLEKRYQASV